LPSFEKKNRAPPVTGGGKNCSRHRPGRPEGENVLLAPNGRGEKTKKIDPDLLGRVTRGEKKRIKKKPSCAACQEEISTRTQEERRRGGEGVGGGLR